MPYIDKTYMLNSVAEAKLNELTGSSDARLLEKISAAESEIDSYLRSKIKALPLADPPDAIRQKAVDITMFHLHDRVQYDDIPEWVQRKYEAAIAYLRDIARGTVTLIPEISESNTETGVLVGGDEPVMTRSFP